MNPLQPIGDLFHNVFYEPIYNILMGVYLALHQVVPFGAFALAIIVLTLALRGALIPLTRKQLKSSREMQVLQPKLKELQAQYKNNPQELMAQQRALYKEHGVSPAKGCLPLVIQMPFLYALYFSFYTVIRGTPTERLHNIQHDLYPFMPHIAHLPETQFFWTSLAQPDPWHILPVVAALLTFIQLRMAMPVRKKPAPGTPSDPTSQATGMMQYIMPFFTLFIGWTFPAGLALYWCVSTGFSAVQQYFISGWGSLFVGIPGMEHMVPEPKEIAAPTPTRTVSAAGARGVVASNPEPSNGGILGMFKQFRETLSAAQSQAAIQAEEKLAERNGKVVESDNPRTPKEPFAVTRTDSAAARERQRRKQQGPMLVKPASSATGPRTDGQADELPEQAIARLGTDETPGAGEPLPEVAIAQIGSGETNGANGAKSAAPRANDTNGMNGASIRPNSGAQRKNSGNNGNNGKGTSSQRSRNGYGRPKGGR